MKVMLLLGAIMVMVFTKCTVSTPGKTLVNNHVVDTGFHLYLLVGQSNMAGRGKVDSLSNIINTKILALDSNGNWKIAKDPIHFDKPVAGVGPGISFAGRILSERSDSTFRIGLIPCAVGGTSIESWFSGQQDPVTKAYPYDAAIERTKLAMKEGVLKGILWHQGEGNNNEERSRGYTEKLSAVVQHFRTDLKGNYPFVFGEIGRFKTVQTINEVIRRSVEVIPNSALVSSEELGDIGDKTHFDTKAARELGRRYAEAMIRLKD